MTYKKFWRNEIASSTAHNFAINGQLYLNFPEEENIYLVLGIYIVVYLHTCFNWYVFAISIFSFIFQVSLQFSVVPRHIVVPLSWYSGQIFGANFLEQGLTLVYGGKCILSQSR